MEVRCLFREHLTGRERIWGFRPAVSLSGSGLAVGCTKRLGRVQRGVGGVFISAFLQRPRLSRCSAHANVPAYRSKLPATMKLFLGSRAHENICTALQKQGRRCRSSCRITLAAHQPKNLQLDALITALHPVCLVAELTHRGQRSVDLARRIHTALTPPSARTAVNNTSITELSNEASTRVPSSTTFLYRSQAIVIGVESGMSAPWRVGGVHWDLRGAAASLLCCGRAANGA